MIGLPQDLQDLQELMFGMNCVNGMIVVKECEYRSS
jgi:hypothetical protein